MFFRKPLILKPLDTIGAAVGATVADIVAPTGAAAPTVPAAGAKAPAIIGKNTIKAAIARKANNPLLPPPPTMRGTKCTTSPSLNFLNSMACTSIIFKSLSKKAKSSSDALLSV